MSAKQGIIAAALLSLLAACGGGGSGPVDTTAANEVPASATASPGAYSRYVGSLATDDRAEPLNVDNVVPPTSESAEPISVS